MKLMVASDIHGSAYYCRKLMNNLERENPNKLILLGDLLYHGPRNDLPKDYKPKQVITMLNEKKEHILCVRGNCDTEVDQMVLEFPILADYIPIYLEALEGRMIVATHGHIYNENQLPLLKKGDILLHGHTHVQAIKDKGDYIYLNPGSISIPKEDNINSYLILEGKKVVIKDLEGNCICSYCF